MRKEVTILLLGFLGWLCLGFTGCATAPVKTVELSEITEQQALSLHNSHIKFVQLFYEKLRNEVNIFLENQWIPEFLSLAVVNEDFRKELDKAYYFGVLNISDIKVTIKDQPIPDKYSKNVESRIEEVLKSERKYLAEVMIAFTKETQFQINKKRKELIDPVNKQERMVINEINAAFFEMQSGQAAIKAYLASEVELKAKQDLILKQLGALKKRNQIMDKILKANDDFSVILENKEKAEDAFSEISSLFKELADALEGFD